MPILNLLNFRSWSLTNLFPTWKGQSLYDFVQANGGAVDLPEQSKRDENKIGWTSGAFDGVTSHHLFDPEGGEQQKRSTEVVRALEAFLKRATEENLSNLYAIVQKEPLISSAEDLQKVMSAKLLNRYKSRIRETGRYLTTRADDRENVKLGIILIELSGDESDLLALELLATHDEFTLYAVVALTHLVSDPEQALWNVAKRVHGWGRVHVVERLNDTQNRDIQAWMLRDGFRNNVMDEYLAGICAKTGQLHEALKPAQIDEALLDGAADILKALVLGGPVDSIDDYAHAPEAVRRYLEHAANALSLDLAHLLCIARLKHFLSDEDGWEQRLSKRWTAEMREEARVMCSALIDRPEWKDKVSWALKSEDDRVFYQADSAAQQLGISTREIHFDRVRAAPSKSSSWYRLLQQTDETQIEEVLNFAARALPLEQIATGPTDSLGFGERYEAHRALDWILQDLKRFPELGWKFLRAGIQSPVTRNRNMALNALLEWPRTAWPDDAEWLLRGALQSEPNGNLRERLKKALQTS
jgi:hypothetical protein